MKSIGSVTFAQRYKTWEHLVGTENANNKKLTPYELAKWARSLKAELECVFDGTHLPLTAQYCPTCKEYKGLQPYIRSWSDWR